MFENIGDLEKQETMCKLFLDAYNVIVESRQEEFKIIEEAESYSLQKNASLNVGDSVKCLQIDKQIRKYYRQLAYKKFLEIADVHPYISRILSKIKLEALREENYKSFLACGLRLRPDYSLDTKMFYADYLVSTIKAPELEAMIEFEKQNRKWGK